MIVFSERRQRNLKKEMMMNEEDDSMSKIQSLIEINFQELNSNTSLKIEIQNSFDIDQMETVLTQNTYLLDLGNMSILRL